MMRLLEVIVHELFPQVYMEGQPPIPASRELQSVRPHIVAFTPLT